MNKGILYMLLSSGMLALFTLFAKFGSEEIGYFELIFFRFSVPFIFVLLYCVYSGGLREALRGGYWKAQLARCSCLLIYQYSIFYYIETGSLLDATVLQNTGPLFLPIFERVFFKHAIRRKDVVCILLGFVGILCMIQPSQGFLSRIGFAALLAPLGHAGSQVFFSHQAKNEAQITSLFYLFFICSVVAGIACIFSPKVLQMPYSWKMGGLILALGLVSLFNQSFRGIAYRHGRPSALAPFLYFSLLFSGLFDWWFFHKLPNALSILGIVLILTAGCIQVYLKMRKRAP
ncbi:MAG: DMT family transporter [Verrucomicrobia bacterium]|nr:DMT family transporter [Verrucomicrobiota bacterium]